MSLGADIAANLPMLREQAESRMQDACVIEKVEYVQDLETLEDVRTVLATTYAGKCRLRFLGNTTEDRDASGQDFAGQTMILSLPVSTSTLVRTDDEVTFTAVDAITGDPALVGLRVRVKGIPHQSQATASRFPVEVFS